MPCCNRLKNPHYKTCVEAYNNSPQTVAATPAALALAGATAVDTGVGASIVGQSINVLCSGLYRVEASVILTAGTAAGTGSLQLYLNGAALPGALAQESLAAGNTATLRVSALLWLSAADAKPILTVWGGGVAGTAELVQASITKLA